MKIISHSDKAPTIFRKFRDLFQQKRGPVLGLLVIIGLVLSIFLFFAIYNYGSYLQQTARTRGYKQMMVDLSKFDVAFVKNYAIGQSTPLVDFDIDIKFKHLQRLQYLREQALAGGFIEKNFKDESFSAKLTHNGQAHEINISLTGELPRAHFGNPNQWSFQVKVKGEDTVLGMRRFGLLVPTARGDLTDWIGFKLLQNRGLIGIRVDYVTVSINGKPTGVYYLEERFDKHLVENNRLREGIIFKIEKAIEPNQEGKLLEDPATRAQLLLLEQMWLNVRAGNLPPQQFFDMQKMARLFAFSDLMNNQHQLSKENLRFYFNPMTNLVEPIAREFENLNRSDPSSLKMFLDEPDPYTVHYWHRMESVIGLIYNNYDFQRYYIREAELLSSKQYLDDFFAGIQPELQLMCQKMYRSWPYFKLPTEVLYANQEKMRAALFPELPQLTAHFDRKTSDQLYLELRNQQHFPIEVAYLSLRDSVFFYPEQEIILNAGSKAFPAGEAIFSFKLPAGSAWSDADPADLKVHYNLLGLEAGKKRIKVYPLTTGTQRPAVADVLPHPGNYASFGFIEESADQQILTIPAGNWSIAQDLIIPAGKQVRIAAGARIDLVNQAGIISYSPVSCRGSLDNPITITSSDKTGAGLQVLHTNRWSELSYTNFTQLSGSDRTDLPATGSVVFYEAPVRIQASNFSANEQGANYLRIIGSEFYMDQAGFYQIPGTAFDCLDCRGSLSNSTFIGMGNNAVQVSGSQARITIKEVFMNHVVSCGISATDHSSVTARWVDIRDAGIAIRGKNQAEITLSDLHLQRTKVGLHLPAEHAQYGPACIVAHRIDLQETENSYLVEQNSRLSLDGKSVEAMR